MSQGQDEFYYSLPYPKMDIALWAYNHNKSAAQLASLADIPEDQASFVYKDIESKRKTTAMLHWPALTLEPVQGPLKKPE